MKHVSRAQLTGTRPTAKGAVRRHRPVQPGKLYPAACGTELPAPPCAPPAHPSALPAGTRGGLLQTGRRRLARQENLCANPRG